jgi:hypothetical protein
VIVFLRSGWVVGQAGVLNAVLIVFATGLLHSSSPLFAWMLARLFPKGNSQKICLRTYIEVIFFIDFVSVFS